RCGGGTEASAGRAAPMRVAARLFPAVPAAGRRGGSVAATRGRHGHWLVLLAAVLWGTTGTAQALAPADASPFAVGAARVFIGGTALLLIAWRRRQLRGRTWHRGAAVAAAAAVAAYQVCFFAGVAATGVATGTLVAIGSAPVFAGLLGWG